MHVVLKFLTYPLFRPSLGCGAAGMAIAYGWFFVGASLLKTDLRALIFLPSIPLFWLSLRVLLRVGQPPNTVCGGTIFAVLLLSLLLGFGGVVLLVLGFFSEI